MTQFSKKIIIFIIAVAIIAIIIFILKPFDSKSGGENAIAFSPQISFSTDYLNRASIPEVAYTDENEGEDLIIRSDKDVYNEFSKSLVFFNVTPLKNRVEKVGFQFIFSDKKAGIIALYQKKGRNWEAIPYSKGALGDQKTLTEAYPQRKEINQNFTINASAFYENYGEPVLFAAELYYPPNTSGEFLIEAFGSQGGYGLLDPWYNSSWQYRKKITIHPDKVATSTNFNNFPMLFSVTDPDFKYIDFNGKFASSTAGEIVFTDHLGNKIDHEIEEYASTTGKLIAWVEAPNLNATTTLYVYYGNGTVPLANQENITGTWDTNYKGVWHLKATTTLNANDSTSNANNGTISGAVTATGQIDGAGDFDGTNDYVSASIDLSATSIITVSFWLYWNAFANDDDAVFQHNTDGTRGNFQSFPNSSGIGFDFATVESGLVAENVRITRPSAGAWHHYAVVMDRAQSAGNVVKPIYVDSISQSITIVESGTLTGNFTNSTLYFMSTQGTANFGAGKVDEFRISNSARSSGWIKTEYNNQSSPSTFYAVGGEEQITRPATTASVRVRSGTGSASKWYSTGWQYRKKITVHPDKVATSTNFNNFPMLFSVTDPDFKYIDFNGKFASSTAGEIVFTDHLGNKIDHEIEEYASTTGKLIAWVEAPNLNATTTLYVYYGNGTVPLANQENITGTWNSNYAGVWHLNEDPTTNSCGGSNDTCDSTSNASHGAATNMEAGDQTKGQIDGSLDFDGTNENISMGDPASLDFGTASFSFGVWFKDSLASGQQFLNKRDTSLSTTAGYHVFTDSANGDVRGRINDSAGNSGITPIWSSTNDAKWHHVMIVVDRSAQTVKLYGDGVQRGANVSASGVGSVTNAVNFKLGSSANDAGFYDGTLDEIRVSSIVLSSDWIKTEYNNQSSPSTFYAVGGEEQNTRPTSTPAVLIRKGFPGGSASSSVRFR